MLACPCGQGQVFPATPPIPATRRQLQDLRVGHSQRSEASAAKPSTTRRQSKTSPGTPENAWYYCARCAPPLVLCVLAPHGDPLGLCEPPVAQNDQYSSAAK